MAIDIRATVTCSLGTLISASISDDYLQGTGLIKCKGSCEISGIVTPAVGDVVTFAYTQAGVTHQVPRKLRVLSSFADPYRRTTRVELGCKLTYLANLAPAPEVDGDPGIVTGKQQQCLNDYVGYPADSLYPIPIEASGVMTTCLGKLGITASQNPLTNKFFIDAFDFAPGYVQVLGDLLVSESYCGYLDYNEVLQVFSLNQEGGTGPVLDASQIIDLSSIGTGDLPGDAVVVFYDSVSLDQDLENEDPEDIVVLKRNFEYEETIGLLQYHNIIGDNGVIYTWAHAPITTTTTIYGQDLSWDDNLCYIAGNEGPDLSDKPIRIVQEQSVIAAEACPNYCAEVIFLGELDQFDPGQIGYITTTKYYTYNNFGDATRIVTETYAPFFYWIGGLNLDFVFSDGRLAIPVDTILLSREIVDIEYLYAQLPSVIYTKPGETIDRLLNGQKVTTTVYENWTRTQSGQQGVAVIRDLFPWGSVEEANSWITAAANTLVLTNQTVTTSTNRIAIGYQRRPPKAARLTNSAGSKQRQVQKLVYSEGTPQAERTITFTMPYQTDDYYNSNGKLIVGDAEAKARVFGRVQNRLLLGNRSGMNVQVAASRIPTAPFQPFVVQANGLSALYRTNGTTWTMDGNGIVMGTDALFWGAVGGTGTFWFPVAPGITALPSTPAVVNGEMTVEAVVPVWNETVLAEGRVRLGVGAQSLPYALQLLTTVPSISTKVGLTAQHVVLPPAAPRLIIHMDGADGSTAVTSTASTSATATITVAGNAALSTSDYFFGPSSLKLTSAGDYVAVVEPSIDVNTSNFTLECWFKLTSGTDYCTILHLLNSFSIDYFPDADPDWPEQLAILYVSDNVGSYLPTPYSAQIALSVWHHLALYRIGTNIYLAVDGEPELISNDASTSLNDTLFIADWIGDGSYQFKGFIDELRFTPSLAVYGSTSFTPPVAPFTDP